MISYIIPGRKAISLFTKQLDEEKGRANNIKDKTNRLSVLTALKSVSEKLRTYHNRTPNNGLIVYCGDVMKKNGQGIKKLMICFEPFKPLNITMYKCDKHFYVDEL
jgi:peptide chain release factor subunit 1